MKKEILNIIDNSEEPVYELDAFITKFYTINKQKSWYYLKEIALEGTLQQKFIVLTVIFANKPDYLEDLLKELIKIRNFSETETLLIPIVKICSLFEKESYILYMLDVLNYAHKNNKEYLEEVTLRSIISTKYWKRVMNNILKIVSALDNITVVDLLAFFIYKQGKSEYNLLLNHLSKNNQKKVAKLQSKILERLKNGYQKLES